DDAWVAAEVFVHDVLDGDESRQPARRQHFQPIRVHANFDPSPAQTVIAVRDGVYDCLTDGELWIFGLFLAFQPFDNGADRHLAPDQIPCRFNQTGEGTRQFFAARIARKPVFAAWGFADEFREYHAALGQPVLWKS